MSQKTNGYKVTNGKTATTGYISENDCCINNSLSSINYYASKNGSYVTYNSNKCKADVFQSYTYENVQEAADFLLQGTTHRPVIAIICGSGLGSLAELLTDEKCFPYGDVPHFPRSTVPGHGDKLIFGLLDGVPVMCMQGRFHYYEGHPICKCAMHVRVMKMIGIKHLIVTNAAGGINDDYKVGDIMIIKDHINLPGFAGVNPLRGPNDERFGTRFPAVSKAYDRNLREAAMQIGREMELEDCMHEGVYGCTGGPNYETVAEIKAMKTLGMDAIGMSTTYEVIVACQSEMTVFAFSLITNKCVTTYDDAVANHMEVIQTGKEREGTLRTFVSRIILHIAQNEGLKE